MNRSDRINASVEKVRKLLLSDLENLPKNIEELYSLCKNPDEEGLVDIFIDVSYGVMSKKDADQAASKLKV